MEAFTAGIGSLGAEILPAITVAAPYAVGVAGAFLGWKYLKRVVGKL